MASEWVGLIDYATDLGEFLRLNCIYNELGSRKSTLGDAAPYQAWQGKEFIYRVYKLPLVVELVRP